MAMAVGVGATSCPGSRVEGTHSVPAASYQAARRHPTPAGGVAAGHPQRRGGGRHCFAPHHMHASAKRILFIAVVVPTLVTAFGASCPCPRGISVQPSRLAWPPGAQVIGAGPVGHGCLPLLGRAGAAGMAQEHEGAGRQVRREYGNCACRAVGPGPPPVLRGRGTGTRHPNEDSQGQQTTQTPQPPPSA